MNGIRTGRASFRTKPATKRRTIASAALKNLSSFTSSPTSGPGSLLRDPAPLQGGGRRLEKRPPGRLEAVGDAHGAAEDGADPGDVEVLAVAVPGVVAGRALLDRLAVRGQGLQELRQHPPGFGLRAPVDEEAFDLPAARLVRRDVAVVEEFVANEVPLDVPLAPGDQGVLGKSQDERRETAAGLD